MPCASGNVWWVGADKAVTHKHAVGVSGGLLDLLLHHFPMALMADCDCGVCCQSSCAVIAVSFSL